ncbi:MAG TPA: M1 family aminopeptidase [Chitinophagaceae bacterium]|jgi:hypothetical protein|nr:M1 family aminopeptidase [Chitinophagaceae bacterium]
MKGFSLFILLLSCLQGAAQTDGTYQHPLRPAPDTTISNSTGTSGTGSNINVIYNRINWTVNPNDASKNITGSVTIHFITTQPSVSMISLDLNKNSFNNGSLSVTHHGNACTTGFPSTGNVNIVSITLPVLIPAINTPDSITINYSGTPPPASGAAQGYQRSSYTDQSGVQQFYVGSLSESYEDRDWWPCKADMQDKIDSMDINVSVPWNGADTFWVATNGKLIDSAINGGIRTFGYKTRYPIASYLVCLSAGKFNRYYRDVQVGATTIPVQYYMLRGKPATYYNNALIALDKVNLVLQAFSQKFGDYPFKLEKHGFYDGLVGAGGMEHQTFSGIATGAMASVSTLSHELMHQWFGDNVTFSTWNDLWLAEGFARYSESLAGELVPSLGLNVHSMRVNTKNSALSNTVSAWIPDGNIANSATIWNTGYGNSVYQRGGMIVSMLRALSGDAIFFQALTNYQTAIAGKSATADSLRDHFNALLGINIAEFFNDYAGGSGNAAAAAGGIGNPVYTIGWNSPVANRLVLRIDNQAKTTFSNVTYYNGPVAVRATAPGKDTTIILFDWGGGNLSYAGRGISEAIGNNLMSYRLSFTPTALVYDDSARTLSTGSTIQDAGFTGYVWHGDINSDWDNPANWSACCGVPPDKDADITIATNVHSPILPRAISIRHLTLNAAKSLFIGTNILTITGVIDGTGVLSGSPGSQLILTGQAGTLNFDQSSANTRSLLSLTLAAGSQVLLASNLEVTTLNANPTANFSVTSGVNLVTK